MTDLPCLYRPRERYAITGVLVQRFALHFEGGEAETVVSVRVYASKRADIGERKGAMKALHEDSTAKGW